MPKAKEPVNPFYVLLVVLGVVFFVTACAYGTMAYRALGPAPVDEGQHALMTFLDQHGVQLMGAELGLLAAATFAAMWLDRFRMRREEPWPNANGSDADRNRPIG